MSDNIYKGLSLDELERLACEYHYRHRDNCGSSEFDMSINDISRAEIDAFKEIYGACFLGKINLYGCDRKNPVVKFTPYTGQKVYNSEYDFALSIDDALLKELITEHNKTHDGVSSQKPKGIVSKIFKRIEEVEGILLTWA